MVSILSNFMKENVPRLLSRYGLSYCKENNCVEYFITDKGTGKEISYAIVFSLNSYAKEIHVSRFCPELYKQTGSRYLSAACFCLLIHHFAHTYHLDETYHISLETRPIVYEKFFSRLDDFNLRDDGLKLGDTVAVMGEYPSLVLETSVIEEKMMGRGAVPFRV